MEVKIGVTHANRELTLDLSVGVDEVHKAVTEALSSENGLVTLTDDKQRTVVIPAEKIAYVEITGGSGRRVGFSG